MMSQTYKRYVLGMLTLVLTMNFLDRGLVMLLLEPIRHDLALSDSQLGFLTGIAFALFYATLGMPLARWSDRGNRVNIASYAIFLWGLTVMACFFVVNFPQLVLARIAAGVGEAGAMPPTYSLVGDYFPGPSERTRAISIYWLGSPLAQLIGFVLGSRLHEHFGWRATFLIMGIPALFLAIIVKLTIQEPRANRSDLQTVRSSASITDVMRVLWKQRTTRHLCVALVLTFTISLGMHPWYAAFMIRSHGMVIDQLGIWLGLIFGVAGIVGIFLGGYVSTRWFSRDERNQVRLTAVMTALLTPCFVLFLLLPESHQALIALIPLVITFNFFLGPIFALMQRLVVEEMRATTLAVIMLLANLIGMGLGPQIVGIVSDRLMPMVGDNSLRYSMLLMSSLALWAAYHFWRASRTVEGDLLLTTRNRTDRPLDSVALIPGTARSEQSI